MVVFSIGNTSRLSSCLQQSNDVMIHCFHHSLHQIHMKNHPEINIINSFPG